MLLFMLSWNVLSKWSKGKGPPEKAPFFNTLVTRNMLSDKCLLNLFGLSYHWIAYGCHVAIINKHLWENMVKLAEEYDSNSCFVACTFGNTVESVPWDKLAFWWLTNPIPQLPAQDCTRLTWPAWEETPQKRVNLVWKQWLIPCSPVTAEQDWCKEKHLWCWESSQQAWSGAVPHRCEAGGRHSSNTAVVWQRWDSLGSQDVLHRNGHRPLLLIFAAAPTSEGITVEWGISNLSCWDPNRSVLLNTGKHALKPVALFTWSRLSETTSEVSGCCAHSDIKWRQSAYK